MYRIIVPEPATRAWTHVTLAGEHASDPAGLDAAGKPVGVVTDRDICCRVVAAGDNPQELTATACMTDSCVTVTPETSIDECCQVLEENQIRRAVVVDEEGRCCGMVAQADVARHASDDKAAEVVKRVSRETDAPSQLQ